MFGLCVFAQKRSSKLTLISIKPSFIWDFYICHACFMPLRNWLSNTLNRPGWEAVAIKIYTQQDSFDV